MLITALSLGFLGWLGYMLYEDIKTHKDISFTPAEVLRDGAVGLGVLVTLYAVLRWYVA